MNPPPTANLASHLPGLAERFPDKPAIVHANGLTPAGASAWSSMTFREIEARTAAFARGFAKIGITAGMRVVLMVRPGLDFLPLTFALFRLGAVPVLIDPGMGKGKLLRCIAVTEPEAFVGIPLAHVVRLFVRGPFRTVKIFVTIGRRWFWGGHDLNDITVPDGELLPITTQPQDLAAIIFTTGSTGPPKGVEYTHGMFDAQRSMLRDAFQMTPNDVDMPGFALFALFTVTQGLTVVLPEMDPTRPAMVNPRRIIDAIHSQHVTVSFGSPALWRTVGTYCERQGITFPTLSRVLMAGAPIPADLHRLMLTHILPPDANVFTPYGATECLPVSSFTGRDVLASTDLLTRQGRGTCVGRPLAGVEVKVIRLSDQAIPTWGEVEELPVGKIGEIVVRGPNVSRQYFAMPEQTALHKIHMPDGTFWHRVGDLGYYDAAGLLWFCGRRAHRVETGEGEMLCTECVEAIFNEHPRVFRSALIGLGKDRYHQKPVIVVEPMPGEFPGKERYMTRFRHELREIAERHPMVAGRVTTFLFHGHFPVDIRHNAKIFREQLAIWARREPDGKG